MVLWCIVRAIKTVTISKSPQFRPWDAKLDQAPLTQNHSGHDTLAKHSKCNELCIRQPEQKNMNVPSLHREILTNIIVPCYFTS
jgi:hypothetical protein